MAVKKKEEQNKKQNQNSTAPTLKEKPETKERRSQESYLSRSEDLQKASKKTRVENSEGQRRNMKEENGRARKWLLSPQKIFKHALDTQGHQLTRKATNGHLGSQTQKLKLPSGGNVMDQPLRTQSTRNKAISKRPAKGKCQIKSSKI
ncbi:hypothetical protein PIB30_069325 [Stylosanthes scabra]|uniref:Uncharacterized protein n=1 Tax=Stylosanthes scabra TaxID=79078 RepID=A0ABU6QNJ4_9FABA|nr:hypothetical protein [Stylosanthes scabra]